MSSENAAGDLNEGNENSENVQAETETYSTTTAALSSSPERLSYYRKLNLDSQHTLDRSLGIMCMMGPSTDDVDVLERMIEAGMTVAALGRTDETKTYDDFKKTIEKIRIANDRVSSRLNLNYPIAIAWKTSGPQIRTGIMEEGLDQKVKLETGNLLTITTNEDYKEKCTKEIVYVDYENIFDDLKPRYRICLNKGAIHLKVNETNKEDKSIVCIITTGGDLSSHSVVHLPDSILEMRTVSEMEENDFKFAIENKLDVIFLTHVQTAEDLQLVRRVSEGQSANILICASIVDQLGFHNFDDIIKEADGILLERGYAGVKLSSWNLFLATRIIIAKCKSVGKPAIVMSRLLRSVSERQEALVPEISNALQVVAESADCLCLDQEVASGPYPVQCIRTLVAVCREARNRVSPEELLDDIGAIALHDGGNSEVINNICVALALRTNAAAIILLSLSGQTAIRVSQLRPICPIVAVTRYSYVARRLQLFKNVHPLYFLGRIRPDRSEDLDVRINFGITYGKYRGFINKGDFLVVMHGLNAGMGKTNTIRTMFASDINMEA